MHLSAQRKLYYMFIMREFKIQLSDRYTADNDKMQYDTHSDA